MSGNNITQRYVQFTSTQRKEICIYKEQNPDESCYKIARWAYNMFHLPVVPCRAVIFKILANSEKWKEMADTMPLRKRETRVKNSQLDEKVAEFVMLCEANQKHISLSHIICKGKQIAEDLHLDAEHRPSFSVGWATCFCKRHGFKSFKSYGESGDADDVAVLNELPNIQTILANYAPRDIFNLDETQIHRFPASTGKKITESQNNNSILLQCRWL